MNNPRKRIVNGAKKSIRHSLKTLNKNRYVGGLFSEVATLRMGGMLTSNRFVATITDDDYLLGVYGLQHHPTWRVMAFTDFERAELAVARAVLPLVENFVDIGAHIGLYSCLVGTKGNNIKTVAFEPNPQNIPSLRKNIELNNIKNWELKEVGLSSEEKAAVLYAGDANGSVMTETFATTPAEQTAITLSTLDHYADLFRGKKGLFLKMDVEGHEYYILQGTKRFFEQSAPDMALIEIVKFWGGGENPHFADTFKFLFERGYAGFEINQEGKNPLLTDMRSVEQLDGGTYFFAQKEIVSKLKEITTLFR